MTGLREQKKWETRRRISDVATQLFRTRGFDNVTVAEVAEAANVSRMTVFNYFPRKEDLVLDRPAEVLATIATTIRERAAGKSIVDVLRALQRKWLADGQPMAGVVASPGSFWTFIQETPALRARALEQRTETRDELVAILRDEGAGEPDARLAAGLIAAVHDTLFDVGFQRVLAGDPLPTVRADQKMLLERAFDALDRALKHFDWAGPR